MEWSGIVLAFLAFFLSHSLPVRPPFRPVLVRVLGKTGFGLAYSALSVAVLAWLIVTAERAPFVPVWNWMPWQNHLVLAVMLPACLTVALSMGSIVRNTSFSIFAGQGIAVVMISSYLPEVLAVSDRILVARQGKFVEEMEPQNATEEAIMYAAVH